jgi:hypothetical protein
MANRRSDRRPFADRRVPTDVLERLCAAAEAQKAHLSFARPDTMVYVDRSFGQVLGNAGRERNRTVVA